MPPSLSEDIIFIIFFYAIFTLIQLIQPYIYLSLKIFNNNVLQLLFWFLIFIMTAILLKHFQNERYKDELEDIEDIFL